MTVITILYPRTDDCTFDMDYYKSVHMPMFAEALGEACEGWGAVSYPAGKYVAMGWAMVTSEEAFGAAMAEHGGRIVADVANYTNVQPDLLIGEHAGGSGD